MLRPRYAISVIICAFQLALAGCSEQAQSDPRMEAPLVRTVIVQAAAPTPRSFTGIVVARVQSDLGFRVSGKVLERLVDMGQPVKRGQPLMRIDPIDLQLAEHAQQEAVAAAQARALQTAEDEVRLRGLQQTGAISASAYDQAKAAADVAKAQLSAAEAQADLARNTSRYAELVADGDGVIVETLAEPGQVVSIGQVVVRLAHAGSREALIQLPETLRPFVGSAGLAKLFGKESQIVGARLRQLSEAADPSTRTFEARYVLEGELARAPLGTTVTIQISAEDSSLQGGLQVPIGALFDAGNGPGVWVINGEPASVSWRAVTVRNLNDSGARIVGEIEEGDNIVALGAHLLREGEQVRVTNRGAVEIEGGRL